MMESIVPASLFGLPQPWSNLSADPRDALVEPGRSAHADALLVIERCLEAASALPDVPAEEFPDFVAVGWSLWAGSFAMQMPSFDEFRLDRIAESFRKQDPDVSSATVRRYGEAWLRKQALDLADTAQIWLLARLRASPHAEALDVLHGIAQRHWRVDVGIALDLLRGLWQLAPQATKMLLEAVVASPGAPAPLVAELQPLLAGDR